MRAAVVHQLGSPLTIDERPQPTPGEGEVLVRLEASGLCHTDIHAANGDWPVKPVAPFVPGHEGVGIVEVTHGDCGWVAVGDRVAIPWLGHACGHCEHCVGGWETLCLAQRNTGYSVDGCYAEYAVADARYVVAVPDGVDPIDAAPLTCAGVTTYKAVKVAGVRPSEIVAIFGTGGLGHMAVQYALIAGGRVAAVDLLPSKLAVATELGASWAINAADGPPEERIQALGGADVAIVTAPSPAAMQSAFRSLRRGGRLVFVGLPADNRFELPIFETVLNGLTVIGSIVGTRRDLAEVFELHAAGRTTVVVDERKLEDVNESFDDVLAGRVDARIVFRIS
jgi:propanol-preferring alcohol dehydrogenase